MGSTIKQEPDIDKSLPYEACPMKEMGDTYVTNFDYAEKSGKVETGAAPLGPQGQITSAWRTAWYEFSQYTTLHGVSRITEETPFTIRR